MPDHGTRAEYQKGCRCFGCRVANAAYQVAYRGHPRDPWIDAGPVRGHLLLLASQGCGARTVAKASGVSRSVLQAITQGTRTCIRRSQAVCVLAVTAEPADGTLVNAWQVKRWIRALLSEGFTKRRLAEQLGLPSRQLHPHTALVRRSTEHRMRSLYSELRIQGPELPPDARASVDALRRSLGRDDPVNPKHD